MMNLHVRTSTCVSLFVTLTTLLIFLTQPSSTSSLESFVYAGCSQIKYQPNTPYDAAVNSLLSSLVGSASYSQYNTLKLPVQNDGVLYSLFQCRGDLSGKSCHDCVSSAVDRLGSYCAASSGGSMQLDGCFVRYDNVSFVGAQDKTTVVDKCGPVVDGDVEADVGGVLAEMGGGGGDYYRVGNVGRVWGVGQCVEDLSVGECQDCLSEAVGRLRSECGSSTWGDMFLGKCYARYSARGSYYSSHKNENDDEVEKTLAILIGLIAGVAILIVFLSFLSRFFDSDKGGK